MFNSLNVIPFNKICQEFYVQLLKQIKNKLNSDNFKAEIVDQGQTISQPQLIKILSYFPVLYPDYSHYYISSYIIKAKKIILSIQSTVTKDKYKQFVNIMQNVCKECEKHIYNKIKQIQCDRDLLKELYYFVQQYFHEMGKQQTDSDDMQYVYNNFPMQILNNVKTSYSKAQMFKYLVSKFKSSKISIVVNEEKSQKCVNIIILEQQTYICDISEEYFIPRHSMATYFYFLLGNKYAYYLFKQHNFEILKEFKFSQVQSDYYDDVGLTVNNNDLIKYIYKYYFKQTILQEQNEIVIPIKIIKQQQEEMNINQYNTSFKLFSLENQLNNVLFTNSQVSVDVTDQYKLHLLQVFEQQIKVLKFKNKTSHYYAQELFDGIFHHIYANSRFKPQSVEFNFLIDQKTYKQHTEEQITQQIAYIVQDLQAFFQQDIQYEYSFSKANQQQNQQEFMVFYINMHFEENKLLILSQHKKLFKTEGSDTKENVETNINDQLVINTQHFAYYTFISECQEIIEYIIHYAKKLQKEIYVPTRFNLTQSKLEIVSYCLLLDYPELWFVTISKYYYNQIENNEEQKTQNNEFIVQKMQIIPDELEEDKIRSYNQQLIEQIQYYIKQKDISYFTLVQKEYYLHSILRHTIVYKDATLANYEFSRDIIGCFVTKQCVCQAIALGFKYLCDLYKIQCITIFGTGRNEGHAWNMIKLQDGYYHVDVTWNLQNDVYGHFNVNDQLCFMKKTLNIKPWIKYPQCNSLHYNYYYIYGKYVDSLNNALEQTVKILTKQISKQQMEKITIFYNIQIKNYSLQEWIQVNKRRVQNKLSRQVNKYYTLQNMQILDEMFLRLDILDNKQTVMKDLPLFYNQQQVTLNKDTVYIIRNKTEDQFLQWYKQNKTHLTEYDIEYHTEDEYLLVQFK